MWAQRLARRLCENCKRRVEIDEGTLSSLDFPFERLVDGDLRFHGAVGCERCSGTGYRGRIGLYELMVVSDSLEELVLRRASTAEMTYLRDDGLIKAAEGITSVEEVLRTVV